MAWTKQEKLHESSIYEEMHTGLTVGMIMTPRDSLLTCRIEEQLSDAVGRNSDQYSFMPVVDDLGKFIGLFDAEPYFHNQPPAESVGQHFLRLSEHALIGANASILDFVRDADQRPCRLVVSGHQIEGLVSIYDMQKLPVRAALFAILTGFEITMAEAIRRQLPRMSSWIGCLAEKRQKSLNAEIEKSKIDDAFVDELLFTQFSDKCDIIRKKFPLKRSKSELARNFKEVRRLRDSLAHANHYANSPDSARSVSAVVRMMFSIRQEIMQTVAMNISPEFTKRHIRIRSRHH